ncbi:MAG: DUF89 family protein [Proteobacteria bacterium]|nr:DUF89 family protein [Pseudomonadota bacterium]
MTHWIYGRGAVSLAAAEKLHLLERVVEAMGGALRRGGSLGETSNRATDAAFACVPAARGGYRAAKEASNLAAAAILPAAAAYVEGGGTRRERLQRACRVAALANVAPLGVPTAPMGFEELRAFLERGEPAPVEAADAAVLEGARRVVYVADNAGEIGLDGLLLRLLRSAGATVTLVVKEPAFFEDATPDDVRHFALDGEVDEVLAVDGFLTPAEAPARVREALAGCDLLVAKGTGSFEALYGELGGTPGVFLLKVKCSAISRALGVPEGRFAVVSVGGL